MNPCKMYKFSGGTTFYDVPPIRVKIGRLPVESTNSRSATGSDMLAVFRPLKPRNVKFCLIFNKSRPF